MADCRDELGEPEARFGHQLGGSGEVLYVADIREEPRGVALYYGVYQHLEVLRLADILGKKSQQVFNINGLLFLLLGNEKYVLVSVWQQFQIHSSLSWGEWLLFIFSNSGYL